MARDYARSRTSRRNARIGEVTPRGGRRPTGQRRLTAYRQPRASRSFLWMISGIFMGLLIAGAFYIKACRHTDAAAIPAKTTENSQKRNNTAVAATLDDPETSELATANASSIAESNRKKLNATKLGKKHVESDQPHYDFYTMLPKDAVDTPQPVEKDKEKVKDKSQHKNLISSRYQVQVGSFTKLHDADHLKAELILQGYTASIHKQQQDGTVRYRVNIGPFSSSKAAVARQQSLGKNKIKSIVVPL